MAERGVAGLSLSEVARRVGVRQPSLYKHFASLHAVYDELFRQGAEQQLEAVVRAVAGCPPGLPALAAAVEAIGRLAMTEPSSVSCSPGGRCQSSNRQQRRSGPASTWSRLLRGVLTEAVARGQLTAAADSDEGVALLSIVVSGALTQQMANEPRASYEGGRFTSLMPRALSMFVQHFTANEQQGES